MNPDPPVRIRLIGWNETETSARKIRLESLGFIVEVGRFDREVLHSLGQSPPAIVVIDLDRQPSTGRDTALSLRQYKLTRFIPLVLAGGEPSKVAVIQTLLPDAAYSRWEQIEQALRDVQAQSIQDPIVRSIMVGYAGTPLTKKLGIRTGMSITLVGAPPDFEECLGALPPRVRLSREEQPADLVLWFVRGAAELESGINRVAALAGRGGLWMIWPKKGSILRSDLTQNLVRACGLANGWVDYKVSAIDATWSGLRFARRSSSPRD